MLTNTSKWSHARGNEVVTSRWQMTVLLGHARAVGYGSTRPSAARQQGRDHRGCRHRGHSATVLAGFGFGGGVGVLCLHEEGRTGSPSQRVHNYARLHYAPVPPRDEDRSGARAPRPIGHLPLAAVSVEGRLARSSV